MTIKFDNVYVKETSTVAGKFESEGPISKCFDKTYSDFYMGEKTFEKGVVKLAWKKIRERNEALDCAVYATAALEMLNPNFDYLSEFYRNGGGKTPSAPRARGTLSRGISI